ncbi:MAG: hypothetical protein IIY23_04385, partial [Erysipelotrichaceae bacterium]|nr:hypothetical protein [Erysipelotrichaceae bacterium]
RGILLVYALDGERTDKAIVLQEVMKASWQTKGSTPLCSMPSGSTETDKKLPFPFPGIRELFLILF